MTGAVQNLTEFGERAWIAKAFELAQPKLIEAIVRYSNLKQRQKKIIK